MWLTVSTQGSFGHDRDADADQAAPQNARCVAEDVRERPIDDEWSCGEECEYERNQSDRREQSRQAERLRDSTDRCAVASTPRGFV